METTTGKPPQTGRSLWTLTADSLYLITG